VDAGGKMLKLNKQNLTCPICNQEIYSGISKGCKMCGMLIKNGEQFCCKTCMRKYNIINNVKGSKNE